MSKRRLQLATILISLSLLACNLGGAAAPDATPSAKVAAGADWQGITFSVPESVAKQWSGKTVPADGAHSGAPENWLVAAHEEITFPDYSVKNQYQPARLMVFAVSGWQDYNPEVPKRIGALQQLLQNRPTTFGAQDEIPVLPIFNAKQVLRVNVSYLNFQNGSGVRFLTQYDQGPMPVNNAELFYTFQGLTADSNYYVAAFFPVTHPSLPADSSGAAAVVGADFISYLDKTTKALETAGADSFTPKIDALDGLLQSLKVK